MRWQVSLVAVAMLAATRAHAEPSAELVVAWSPGHPVAAIAAAAHAAGASLVDRTPSPPQADPLPALLAEGIAAYDALRFDEASRVLGRAGELADRTGAPGLTTARLADLFLYRGLVQLQLGDPAAAWDELVRSAVVDPTRLLDPARFPPKVIAELDRARASVNAAPRVVLSIDQPAGCTTRVDGTPATEAPLAVGAHWLATSCPDRTPWGARIALATATTVIAHPLALAPPDDGDLLVQARVAGAHALVIAIVRGELATVRLLSVDGRELKRRTVSAGEAAAAVSALLVAPTRRHWYTARWAWAAGAAVVAAAILIPLTAAIASEHDTGTATVRPTGVTW